MELRSWHGHEEGTVDPSLPRVAAIDIGTNTVKLTIAAREADGTLHHIADAAATPRLGSGTRHGRIPLGNMLRTVHVLKECVELCRRYSVVSVVAVGTAALREAKNAQDFLHLTRDIGLPVEVLSGDEEARLSALAVRSDPRWRDAASLMVLDIGGGSTEVIFDSDGRSQTRTSLPIGAVRVSEACFHHDPPLSTEVEEARAGIGQAYASVSWPEVRLTAVGVGGTMTNMGAVALAHRGSSETDALHGTVLGMQEVRRQIQLYASIPDAERKRIAGLDPARSDVILAGALVAEGALEAGNIEAIAVSCRGLRWGVLYDRFGKSARAIAASEQTNIGRPH